MPMTVAGVLSMPSVRQGLPEVVAGESALDTEVRWVHVSEVRNISQLLHGGELILSTGLTMTGDAGDDKAFIRELARAGAAGLVIELGAQTASPDSEVIGFARELGFPLILLNRQVRFVSITEEVHRAIVSDQYAEMEFAQRVHEAFTALSLAQASAWQILEVLGGFCGAAVVLEDITRNVVGFWAGDVQESELIAEWESRSRMAPVRADSGLTGPEGWLTCPVGPLKSPWARLVLPDPQESARHGRLLMAMERASSALEIARMAERERVGLLIQAQGGLLIDLESGSVDESTAMARAVGLGLRKGESYLPLVVRSPRPGDTGGEPLAAQRQARGLLERVSRAVRESHFSALIGVLAPNEVGVLLTLGSDLRNRRLPESVALERLGEAIEGHDLVVGVGPAAPEITGAGRALGSTRHTAQVASSLSPATGERRTFFKNSDVRLPGLVAMIAGDPRVQSFVESELGPLLEHEAIHHDGLVALLRRYLELGGNKSQLAVDVSRSRSSLYDRLHRIETILRLDISDTTSQMSLGFAFMAYDQSRRRTLSRT